MRGASMATAIRDISATTADTESKKLNRAVTAGTIFVIAFFAVVIALIITNPAVTPVLAEDMATDKTVGTQPNTTNKNTTSTKPDIKVLEDETTVTKDETTGTDTEPTVVHNDGGAAPASASKSVSPGTDTSSKAKVWHEPVYKTVHHDAVYETEVVPAVYEEIYYIYFHYDGFTLYPPNYTQENIIAHQKELAKIPADGSWTTLSEARLVTPETTKQVLVKEAYDEQVLVKEGYWE
jgi:hypothetical protein